MTIEPKSVLTSTLDDLWKDGNRKKKCFIDSTPHKISFRL